MSKLLFCLRAPPRDPSHPPIDPADPLQPMVGEELDKDDLRRRSLELDRQLKADAKQEKNTIKLLMLGTGESGKTTFSKQMKILHVKEGITEEEKRSTIGIIRSNLRESITCLCRALTDLDIPLEHTENVSRVQCVCGWSEKDIGQEFYDCVTPLWQDAGIQKCFQSSNQFQLIDSAKYFIERVSEIRQPDYHPTDQDVLRSRLMTTNISVIKFSVPYRSSSVNFHLYDAGGQKGERRKWFQVFTNATAVLFIVDSTSYAYRVREDTQQNRLLESLEIFNQVWTNTFLQEADVFVFLNKIDLLEENCKHGRFFDNFVNDLAQSHPYHDFMQTWHDWRGPTEKESREFVKAYPTFGGESSHSETDITEGRRRSSGGFRLGPRRTSGPRISVPEMLQQKNISTDTVKTAVFLRKLFIHMLSHPMSRRASIPEGRGCQIFYTCAVDTDTVRKVMSACENTLTKNI